MHDDAFGGTTTLLAQLQSTTAAKAAALKVPLGLRYGSDHSGAGSMASRDLTLRQLSLEQTTQVLHAEKEAQNLRLGEN